MQASVHNGKSLPRRSDSRPGVVDVVGGSFQNGVVSNMQGRRQHGLLKLDIPSSQVMPSEFSFDIAHPPQMHQWLFGGAVRKLAGSDRAQAPVNFAVRHRSGSNS